MQAHQVPFQKERRPFRKMMSLFFFICFWATMVVCVASKIDNDTPESREPSFSSLRAICESTKQEKARDHKYSVLGEDYQTELRRTHDGIDQAVNPQKSLKFWLRGRTKCSQFEYFCC
jgi:hypothetical protein